MDHDIRLAAYFAELSEELSSTPDEPLTFQRVVRRAVEVVPGCNHCGLTLRRRRGRAESAATTDDIAAEADTLQHALADGPCVDAAFEQENFVVRDLRTETRWPIWAPRAAKLGIRSVLAIRLTSDHESIGALNLYGGSVGAFDGDQDIAMIFASHAAEAMSTARLVSGLRNAMDSRHTIGIAQGVLAVRYSISYERAFQVLHRYSNDHNIKLRDLAEQVLAERGLPGNNINNNNASNAVDTTVDTPSTATPPSGSR
jgi:GAF domain-containing protein